MESARDRHIRTLERLKQELKTAGPIHRKDLQRAIYRMEKELIIYDRYRSQTRIPG